jgi:F-type H+-transporting ATPase subunit b
MTLRLFLTLFVLISVSPVALAQNVQATEDPAQVVTQDVATTDVALTATEALVKKASGLPQFDPKWWPNQIFWIGITFMAMYVFFGKYALPRIESTVTGREQHIKSFLDEVESLSQQAEDVKSSYESMLNKALQDADDAATRVAEESKSRLSHALQVFRIHHDKEIAESSARLQKIHDDIMKDMDTIVAQAANAIAQKLAGVSSDQTQAENLVKSLNDKAKAA